MDIADALPGEIAAQMAQNQKNVALAVLKKTAETQQQIADILTATISNRGQNVNLFA